MVVDLRQSSAQRVAHEIVASGGKSTGVSCDVSNSQALRAVFEHVYEDKKRIDIVLNNAGIATEGFPRLFILCSRFQICGNRYRLETICLCGEEWLVLI